MRRTNRQRRRTTCAARTGDDGGQQAPHEQAMTADNSIVPTPHDRDKKSMIGAVFLWQNIRSYARIEKARKHKRFTK